MDISTVQSRQPKRPSFNSRDDTPSFLNAQPECNRRNRTVRVRVAEYYQNMQKMDESGVLDLQMESARIDCLIRVRCVPDGIGRFRIKEAHSEEHIVIPNMPKLCSLDQFITIRHRN